MSAVAVIPTSMELFRSVELNPTEVIRAVLICAAVGTPPMRKCGYVNVVDNV